MCSEQIYVPYLNIASLKISGHLSHRYTHNLPPLPPHTSSIPGMQDRRHQEQTLPPHPSLGLPPSVSGVGGEGVGRWRTK
jgi:hypothetical protein